MQTNLVVTTNPHVFSTRTTRTIMLDVIIALIPAGVAGVYFFGLNSALVILLSVMSAVLTEAVMQKLMKKRISIDDLSAVVTGLLLAYNLPPTAPWWLPVVGSAIAIALVKQLFGGVGQNFMNPALIARAVLTASWVSLMTADAFIQPIVWGQSVDFISTSTPLSSPSSVTFFNLFIGRIGGCIGETSKLALLIGFGYMLLRKVISWRIPVIFITSVFILYLIKDSFQLDSALYQILSGGLFLGAIFMATDYASSPVSPLGQIIFAVGCGLLLFVIRAYNPTYPEGCSYAILLMNILAPQIDKFTKPRVYGEVKRHG